jgi:lysophospholipase L1-like esterase
MLHVALGDSITHGYSASSDQTSYIHRLGVTMYRKNPPNVYLQAKPGWTSRQLLKSVKSIQEAVWNEARLVTLMIGGNDLLYSVPWLLNGGDAQIIKVADKLYQNITEIVEIAKRPHHKFIIATLYNPFPNSMRAEEFTNRVNQSIRLVAKRHGLTVADVRRAFSGREGKFIEGYRRGQLRDLRLIHNPVHPNDAGHAVIARAFQRASQRAQENRMRKSVRKR